MPQSLQSIYSFDCEVIFCVLKFSPFLSWSVFVDCGIKITMVSQRIWHILHLFFNIFVPNGCNNDDDVDDDDDDDHDINGFVMIMWMFTGF